MVERHKPTTHPTVGEEHLSRWNWDRGMEKNMVSNGDLERLRKDLLPPAISSEAVGKQSFKVHSEPRI